MKNRGITRLTAVLLCLVCLFLIQAPPLAQAANKKSNDVTCTDLFFYDFETQNGDFYYQAGATFTNNTKKKLKVTYYFFFVNGNNEETEVWADTLMLQPLESKRDCFYETMTPATRANLKSYMVRFSVN